MARAPSVWQSGSSSDTCDEDYRGPTAASEPETRNLVAYVAGSPGTDGVYSGGLLPDRRPDNVSIASPDDYAGLFFDIHSYSQLVLWPWGDTTNAAPNRMPLQTFGRRLAWFNGYTPERSAALFERLEAHVVAFEHDALGRGLGGLDGHFSLSRIWARPAR